jgi:alkaline phosphatase D
MPINRRSLLQLLSSSTFFLTVAPGAVLAGEMPQGNPAVSFPQGVASGDPQPDGIMLWTRAEPVGATNTVDVMLQVSSEPDFSTIVLQSKLSTGPDSDFTLRAYINGLEPDRFYYYRFLTGPETVSRTGRTRTAPAAGQERPIKMAFASCQSFEQAYYGSWARMLADDRAAPESERIDFVLHLGDFIYERSWPTLVDGSPLSRRIPDFPDGMETPKNRYAVSLADYRHLYKTYLEDPHLQEARAMWPFVCTWDDHEYSNDNYQSVSTYHGEHLTNPARKVSANQAWFEFIPAVLDEQQDQPAYNFQKPGEKLDNDSAVQSLCIYRRLRWGKHLDIVLTDSRSYRSAPCLEDGFSASLGLPLDTVELVEITDSGREYSDGNPPATLPYGDGRVPNPAKDRAPGTILGQTQRDWFLDTLQNSTARWKLWGNALPLVPQRLDMSSLPFTDFQDSLINIDGWAGFPYEFNLLMRELEDRKVTGLISLSGDHHMHAAAAVSHTGRGDSPAVAVDFAVAGISSAPVFGDVYNAAHKDHPDFQPLVYVENEGNIEPVWHMSMLQGVLAAYAYSNTGSRTVASWLGPNTANRGLQYLDTTANGYGLATFAQDAVQVELVTMEDCTKAFESAPAKQLSAHFRVGTWVSGDSAVLEGPEFEGGAPFPFKAPEV